MVNILSRSSKTCSMIGWKHTKECNVAPFCHSSQITTYSNHCSWPKIFRVAGNVQLQLTTYVQEILWVTLDSQLMRVAHDPNINGILYFPKHFHRTELNVYVPLQGASFKPQMHIMAPICGVTDVCYTWSPVTQFFLSYFSDLPSEKSPDESNATHFSGNSFTYTELHIYTFFSMKHAGREFWQTYKGYSQAHV